MLSFSVFPLFSLVLWFYPFIPGRMKEPKRTLPARCGQLAAEEGDAQEAFQNAAWF